MTNTHTALSKTMVELSEARSRIAESLLEIDTITLQINPQIEAEYATTIGYLENELLKCQIAARRARRRYSLAQAQTNSGQPVNSEKLEAQLDEEFSEWESSLAQSIEAFLQSTERLMGSKPLSPSETRELKHLHRTLIKRLHPDLNPGQTKEASRFFLVAQSAYEDGDLQTLRAVALVTEGMEQMPDGDLTTDEAAAELELVLAQERVVEQQLRELKRSNPYALKEKLADGAWVIERVTSLKAAIEEQKAAARAYDERFRSLVKDGCND